MLDVLSRREGSGVTAIAEVLVRHRIDRVFGIPGGSISPVFDALYGALESEPGIRTRTASEEADPARGEIWSEASDRDGVWGEACQTSPQAVYRVGDPRANCTRGNGVPDTEDLNGNGILDADDGQGGVPKHAE